MRRFSCERYLWKRTQKCKKDGRKEGGKEGGKLVERLRDCAGGFGNIYFMYGCLILLAERPRSNPGKEKHFGTLYSVVLPLCW